MSLAGTTILAPSRSYQLTKVWYGLHWSTAYMDYMDLGVHYPRKVVKLTHSFDPSLTYVITNITYLSSHCNSSEDWVPVDGIYGYPVLIWVAVTWLEWQGASLVVSVMVTRAHALLIKGSFRMDYEKDSNLNYAFLKTRHFFIWF